MLPRDGRRAERSENVRPADASVIRAGLSSVHRHEAFAPSNKMNGAGVMDSLLERRTAADRLPRGACLVAGCPCKDARIVSPRRAAFFAAWARDHGETANRVVEPDDATWRAIFQPRPGPF
jgi:hypothetical protein